MGVARLKAPPEYIYGPRLTIGEHFVPELVVTLCAQMLAEIAAGHGQVQCIDRIRKIICY